VTPEAKDHRGARERRALVGLRVHVAPRDRRELRVRAVPPVSEVPAAPPGRMAAAVDVAGGVPAALADHGDPRA